jgi:hypothetical protein
MKTKFLALFLCILCLGFLPQPVGAAILQTGYPYVFSQPLVSLPAGASTLIVGNETFYFLKGSFYQFNMREQVYVAVPPPIGVVIYNLPPGYQMMISNGVAYYLYNGVYYKRLLNGYRVIEPPALVVF